MHRRCHSGRSDHPRRSPRPVAAKAKPAKDNSRIPIPRPTRQLRPTFKNQTPGPPPRELQRPRAAADTGADDHDVMGLLRPHLIAPAVSFKAAGLKLIG